MFISHQIVLFVAAGAVTLGAIFGGGATHWLAGTREKAMLLEHERERQKLQDQITKFKQESADAAIRQERAVRDAEHAAREREIALEKSIADLRGDASKLRKRVAALTSATTAPAETSCRDLRFINSQLGRMVERIDDFAGRAGEAADRTTDALVLCRDYIRAIQK